RVDDHAAARPQPLRRTREDVRAQAEGGVPRDQVERALVEGPDPAGVPEYGLLRRPRLRSRGGRADVLLRPRPEPEPPPGRADRRAAAGAFDLRPVPRSAGGDRAAERGAAGDARAAADHA